MEHSDIVGFLSEHSLFEGLAGDHLEMLAQHAQVKTLSHGDVLASQGAPAKSFYLVLEGALVIEVPAIAGPKLEITRLGAGDVFGWSWLIAPYTWHFHARASGATKVLAFDGESLLQRCDEDAEFGYPLLRRFSGLMAERLDAAQRKMMDQWSPPGFA